MKEEHSVPTLLDQSSTITFQLDIISDVICPWCWIGKRRLSKALAMLPGHAAAVTWHPFELNPGTPKAGLDRRDYRRRKFGSMERSQALDAQVAAAGRSEGIEFRHDRMLRTPNTVDAHRLLWLAAPHGCQDFIAEALFVAYFHDGQDVGEHAVLTGIAERAGIGEAASAMLASSDGLAETEAGLAAAASMGVSGVPTFAVNGRPVFSGALAPEDMAARLAAAVRN